MQKKLIILFRKSASRGRVVEATDFRVWVAIYLHSIPLNYLLITFTRYMICRFAPLLFLLQRTCPLPMKKQEGQSKGGLSPSKNNRTSLNLLLLFHIYCVEAHFIWKPKKWKLRLFTKFNRDIGKSFFITSYSRETGPWLN